MKYYKLYAALDKLDPSHYYVVYDTFNFSHASELALKTIRLLAKRYLDSGIDCYIRGFVESIVEIEELD